MFGDTVPSELPDKWAMSIRQPIGVAGIITPWNFPIAIPAWKMMPALVAGNTVVFKPASDTPHCAALLVELLAEAGLPPGVVNLVTGAGAEVGDAIVDRPMCRSSVVHRPSAIGRRIAERAGRRLKRVSLELGGKNAIIVLADADLDLAVDGIMWCAFGTTGQRCTACSRVIVRASRGGAPRRAARGANARPAPRGRGWTRRPTSGRSSTRPPGARSSGYVEVGRREGRARHAAVGRPPAPGLEARRTTSSRPSSPTSADGRIAQEEIFGPVLSVIPVPDYDAAITALNQTRYGLSSAIYTTDVNTAFRAMRDLETGLVYINAARSAPRRTFRSGAGRRRATATARPATPPSTRSPNGSRSTSTSRAAPAGADRQPARLTGPGRRPAGVGQLSA